MEPCFPRLLRDFFVRDVLEVAPSLLGKTLVRKFDDGSIGRFAITEIEAYRGDGDLACHASRGKTARNEVMFREGGLVYVYFIYGMYWMLNFVTGEAGDASAVLIRGLDEIEAPRVRAGEESDSVKNFSSVLFACPAAEPTGNALTGIHGPGKIGKILQLDRSFYGENLSDSQRIWIEDSPEQSAFATHPRVGIHYAGEPWVSMPWRYKLI